MLDFGSGSGICAIAAAKAGARSVQAAETDFYAKGVIAMNALVNGVTVAIIGEDLIGRPACPWDVVLAGDVWYERFMAGRVTPWLEYLSREGANVLMGDRGRAFFRPARAIEVGHYRVPGFHGVERNLVTETCVWTLDKP